jgi:hypothetical protein
MKGSKFHSPFPKQHKFFLGVRSSPIIRDVSELQTILIISLRALFGELESYSFGMVVNKLEDCKISNTENVTSRSCDFVVECLSESALDAIRSALTMPTLPSYLAGTVIYRFDTVECGSDAAAKTTIKEDSTWIEKTT